MLSFLIFSGESKENIGLKRVKDVLKSSAENRRPTFFLCTGAGDIDIIIRNNWKIYLDCFEVKQANIIRRTCQITKNVIAQEVEVQSNNTRKTKFIVTKSTAQTSLRKVCKPETTGHQAQVNDVQLNIRCSEDIQGVL